MYVPVTAVLTAHPGIVGTYLKWEQRMRHRGMMSAKAFKLLLSEYVSAVNQVAMMLRGVRVLVPVLAVVQVDPRSVPATRH